MTMILCDRNITVNDESSSSWYGTPTYFMHNVHTFETCKMYSARPPHWQVPEVERITYRVNCARRYNDNRARDWTRKRIAKTGKKPYSRRTCNITIRENERFFVQYIRPIVKEVVTSDDIGIITRVYYNMHKICRGSLRLCCIRAQRCRRKRYNISLLLPYDRMCTCVRMKPHCKRVFLCEKREIARSEHFGQKAETRHLSTRDRAKGSRKPNFRTLLVAWCWQRQCQQAGNRECV